MGTFYDLLDRFWLGEKPCRTRKAGKKRTKLADGEKLLPKHPGVVERLVARLLEGRAFTCREESVLHQILAISAVRPSLELGLLGDPKDMTIAGDGSIYENGGSPHVKSRVSSPSRHISRMSITGLIWCLSHSFTISFVSS